MIRTKPAHPQESIARRLILGGGVQGLGVRPAIYRLAAMLGVRGVVRNTSRGVELEIEGTPGSIASFEQRLPSVLPAAASLNGLLSQSIPTAGRTEFAIEKEPSDGPLAVRVPEDRAICAECAREIEDRGNRRHVYPFTSCTQCGPRYTVIRAMPFEREDTTMARFIFCPPCWDEYERPGDRRFHAQTTACPACGPRVWGVDGPGRSVHGAEALRAGVERLASGEIVALRGLGGYQLLVDATNQAAVERLRQRKGRRAKPLAVMVDSHQMAERLALVDAAEMAAFRDPAAPIVLVRARAEGGLAPAIHPHLDTVGVMRPTTPLHAILASRFGRPLVCTSGNREGEPLEYEVQGAQRGLSGVADFMIHHDRDLARPIDDSVVRIIAGRQVAIRLARGLAPLPLDLPPLPPTIALGGYLKAAGAWSNGTQAVLGPHVGDQESLSARERLLEHLADVQRLYRFKPERLVCDLHPEYFSTQWAEGQSLETVPVQHHHAHIVAGMLDHGWLDRRVLGVAWDGTGYGSDGTIWGGEFLICTAASFERVARLRPFRRPGGEAAIREPWRIALSICHHLGSGEKGVRTVFRGKSITATESVASKNSSDPFFRMIDRPQISPLTSSAGRLIDAAASLILGIDRADFDGQAAMRLEAVADRGAAGQYPFSISDGQMAELDWRPLFAALLQDIERGVDPGRVSMRFHRTLAHGIAAVCRRYCRLPIVLSGGVFQNRLLTELVVETLADQVRPLGLPGFIPPNDGGLAAGQLAIAAAKGHRQPCA